MPPIPLPRHLAATPRGGGALTESEPAMPTKSKPATRQLWIRVPPAARAQLAALCRRTGRSQQQELSFALLDYLQNRPETVELPSELQGKVRDVPGLTFRIAAKRWQELCDFADQNGHNYAVEVGLAILAHVAQGPRPLPHEMQN